MQQEVPNFISLHRVFFQMYFLKIETGLLDGTKLFQVMFNLELTDIHSVQ